MCPYSEGPLSEVPLYMYVRMVYAYYDVVVVFEKKKKTYCTLAVRRKVPYARRRSYFI